MIRGGLNRAPSGGSESEITLICIREGREPGAYFQLRGEELILHKVFEILKKGQGQVGTVKGGGGEEAELSPETLCLAGRGHPIKTVIPQLAALQYGDPITPRIWEAGARGARPGARRSHSARFWAKIPIW